MFKTFHFTNAIKTIIEDIEVVILSQLKIKQNISVSRTIGISAIVQLEKSPPQFLSKVSRQR